MQVIDIVIPYVNSNSKHYIYPFNDWHLGAKGCHEGKVNKLVAEVAEEPNAHVIGMGDIIDAITMKDKRWDTAQVAKWVDKNNIVTSQEDKVIEIVTPVIGKIKSWGYGQHEDTVRKHYQQNAHKNIIDKLNAKRKLMHTFLDFEDIPPIQNAGFSCFLRIYFERENSRERHMFTGWCTHGSTSAITKAGKTSALHRAASHREADFHLYAHVHELDFKPDDYLCVRGRRGAGKIKSLKKPAALCGSLLMTYTQGPEASYGEMRTYDPTSLGSIRVMLDPQHGKVRVEEVDLQ